MITKKLQKQQQQQQPLASPAAPQNQSGNSTPTQVHNMSGQLAPQPPQTKTQAQPTPMPSLSPVLAHSPAQSAGASPQQQTGANVLQSQSFVLAQNSNWLAQTSERIEKTIELINTKKIREALQILLDINQVFESSGVCVSTTTAGIDSTKSTSPIPGSSKSQDLSARRNKTSVQLAIITKYNLACCFQTLGESKKCIKYLQQASRQLSFYSSMDAPQGLFKVNVLNDKLSMAKKGGSTNTHGDAVDNTRTDSGVDFNEYNCVGASSSKGNDNESLDQQLRQQSHDQLSAQLQANRYLCKFHLQLCAIMSQMGQHVQANENGQQAATIAEAILIKTNDFCQMSVDELLQRDSKFKSIIDQSAEEATDNSTMREDYQGVGTSLKSSMQIQHMKSHRKKLTRGSSVTSLYSQEKERKSVSIRRSRSGAHTMRARDSSQASEESTQSLERMYTFNLSRVQRQSGAATAKDKAPTVNKKDALMATEGLKPLQKANIDFYPADMQAKEGKATGETATNTQANPGPEEGRKTQELCDDRSVSQASKSAARASSTSFCPTYQVLERTNIQEKLILNVQPLLEEFKRVSEEFNQRNLTLDEAETHDRIPQFGSSREIQTVKQNKRFKINVRNTLGVKDHNNWIYNLNIGNVMNLTPMNSDELNSQSDVFQELSKDTMLEKIILYVVAYFCVGTEIRFQATKLEKEKKGSPQEYIKVWSSEMWHGKSLQVASMFLPEDCPLVDHIIKSYKKHYIGKQSLLSVVVQPQPSNPLIQANLSSSSETKLAQLSIDQNEQPTSQQEIGEAISVVNRTSEEIKQKQKTPAIADTTQGKRDDKALQKQIMHAQAISQLMSIPGGISADQVNLLARLSQKATKETQNRKSKQSLTNSSRDDEALPSGRKKLTQTTLTKSALSSSMHKLLSGSQSVSKTLNSKQRQKTLKDMVFNSLNPATALEVNTAASEEALEPNTLMQYNKMPPRSPDSPTLSEPIGENPESISMLSKGVPSCVTKVSRNKPSAARKSGADPTGNDEIATQLGGGAQQLDSFEPKKTANELSSSPSVRRRGFQPVKQSQQVTHQRATSPTMVTQEALHYQQDQKTEVAAGKKATRQLAQTITYSDIKRLQQNLNIQIQQNQQQQQKSFLKAHQKNHITNQQQLLQNQKGVIVGSKEKTTLVNHLMPSSDRPQSANPPVPKAKEETAAKPPQSAGQAKRRAENRGSSANDIQGGTPARQSAHKRYQPSITSSLQKLVSKPGYSSKGHSKVLQSEAAHNSQAWHSAASGGGGNMTSKQSKQKVIMLPKQKKLLQQAASTAQLSTALWLAQNPASDKLHSNQPVQISTTKFMDSQLKMMPSSGTSTARGSKKQTTMGSSPKSYHHAVEGSKREGALVDSVRKKPTSELQRAFETAPSQSQSVAGLSKSIAKEKYHQANLIPHAPIASAATHKASVHAIINKLGSAVGNSQSSSHSLKKSASTRQVVNLLDLQHHHHHQHVYGGTGSKKMAQKVSTAVAASPATSSNFKTLSKKHKNTKSTGLLQQQPQQQQPSSMSHHQNTAAQQM